VGDAARRSHRADRPAAHAAMRSVVPHRLPARPGPPCRSRRARRCSK
jgi:hypothetical protein